MTEDVIPGYGWNPWAMVPSTACKHRGALTWEMPRDASPAPQPEHPSQRGEHGLKYLWPTYGSQDSLFLTLTWM